MLLKTIEQGKQSPLNNDEWGLKRFQLEEVEINAQGRVNHPAAANLLKDDLGPFFGPVAAINPRFEPQILTVKYLKRNPEKFDQTNYQKKNNFGSPHFNYSYTLFCFHLITRSNRISQ